MNREEIFNFRLRHLINNIDTYKFNEILSMLRHYLGVQRKHVAEATGITECRLFYLEHGRFKRKAKYHEIRILSEYYGINYQVLKEKSDEFYKQGLGRPQDAKESFEEKVS